MLLLYPFTSSFASPFSFSYLHSTMLLLYHNLYGSIVLDEIIYIPLCFYFIQPCQVHRRRRVLIYIPLCFYFIGRHRIDDVCRFFIYIPLCFYFILGQPLFSFDEFIIYIPLCFYFIEVVLRPACLRRSNLHSTMLLLYLQRSE